MIQEFYKITMRVTFEQDYYVFAKDEDEAIEWAEKEASLDVPMENFAETEVLAITKEMDYNDDDR